MYLSNLENPSIQPLAGRSADRGTLSLLKVWLDVSAPSRPDNLALYLDELARPDFSLDNCRESVCLDNDRSGRYYGQWYCCFIRMNSNTGADANLRERFFANGIHVLRFG